MFMRFQLILIALCLLFLYGTASALVTEGDMPAPSNGYIGSWVGSSGVPIASRWILTMNHIGGSSTSYFWFEGQAYQAAEYHRYIGGDMVLVKLSRDLPAGRWHRLVRRSLSVGEALTIGGNGETRAEALADNAGYRRSSSRQLRWGRNTFSGIGYYLAFQFSRPTDSDAMPYEAQAAPGDSGGGVFVTASDGQLELAGIMQSISGGSDNAARYGDATYAQNLEQYLPWIDSLVPLSAPTPNPTASPSPSSTPTAVPTATATPMATATASATSTTKPTSTTPPISTPTPTPLVTSTISPTTTPRPIASTTPIAIPSPTSRAEITPLPRSTPKSTPKPGSKIKSKLKLKLKVQQRGKAVTIETRLSKAPRAPLATAGHDCELLIYTARKQGNPLRSTPTVLSPKTRHHFRDVGILKRGQLLRVQARLDCVEKFFESNAVPLRGSLARGVTEKQFDSRLRALAVGK